MGTTSPIEKTRLAIAGCGRMGRLHAERILTDGRGQVVAICDHNRTMSGSLRRDLAPDCEVFEDLSQILDAELADAIVICSPTKSHFEQATACLNRGLHVLCEKPLATSRDEILSLIHLSQTSGRHLMIGYQRRFSTIYRTLRREVLSGRWGKVRAVHSHNIENWQSTVGGTWRDDPDVNPGGFIGDAGSHKIDIVFFVTGLTPRELFARTDNCGSHVEVTASVSGMLSDDVPVTMDFIGCASHFAELLHICCTEADLIVRGESLTVGRNERVEPISEMEPESIPIVAFLDVIRDGGANDAPPACALPVFDFTQAILRSGRSGQTVAIRQ
jgi:predicted dehydrogenase